MGRRLPSPYEYLGATEEELKVILSLLDDKDKELFYERYGKDLHNPVSSKTFNVIKANNYYSDLAPRMRDILEKIRNEQPDDYSDEVILEIMEELDEAEENNKLESKLIEALINNKSNIEICRELGIGNEKLYKMLYDLKGKGKEIDTKYYSDGSIHYSVIKSLDSLKSVNSFGSYKTLFTDVRDQKMKFLLISDLHFGNELARLDLVKKAFDYCDKNDIHTILCGGDLIDGSIGKGKKSIGNVRKQIDYFIDNYPHHDNIITFSVGGNRDVSAIDDFGINIAKLCENYRPDVVIGGFENMFLNVKKDQIMMHHQFSENPLPSSRAPIVIRGDSHNCIVDGTKDKLDIVLPSLSNINTDCPSALELEVEFKDGLFSTTSIKHIKFGEKFGEKNIVLGVSRFDLYSESRLNDNNMKNEEYYKKGYSKSLKPKSQMDMYYKKGNK